MIPMDALEDWAKQKGFKLFKTSALDYNTIEPMFLEISEDISESNEIQQNEQNCLVENKQENKSCC